LVKLSKRSARFGLLIEIRKLEFTAPVTGAKKEGFMKPSNKTNKIFNGTYGKMRVVDDFLPTPEDLVLKAPQKVKVTLNLEKSSVDVFKSQARKLGGSYQRMIRNLVDQYAKTLPR
jgi:hypothetical protein